MEWTKKALEENETPNILTFKEYIKLFEENPHKETRPSFKYIYDMMNHFGLDKDQNYKLFKKESTKSPAVQGHQRPQKRIVENLENFIKEGASSKFVLLVGPNGSAKSTLVKKIMKGAEEYSETDEGSLYTFSWVFPVDSLVKGSLGLNPDQKINKEISFAHLRENQITAIIESELKDHPILLIPQKYRKEFLEKQFKNDKKHLEMIKQTYFFNGDISKKNRLIYDALLKNYHGDHTQVLKHIRVERFTISRRYSSSAVTIEPQLHVDAQLQQITMDRRLATLPAGLQSLNLFSMRGELVYANRGILEYSDLLKRPLDTFKYLLMTMETGTINLQGILTELDLFFIGTSNEVHLQAFMQHPDFNSFKGRFNFIKIPYLLNYQDECDIYQKQINSIKDHTTFGSYSLKALALFAVLSRLRLPLAKNYTDKKFANIAINLSPLEKAEFLATGKTPDGLNSEQKLILVQGKEKIISEFENDSDYEGKFGLSPRDIKNIIYKLASKNEEITFIEILEFLENLIKKKNQYDFLNINVQGNYHNPKIFISMIKELLTNTVDSEIRESLGLVDERSYDDYIKRYIENVSAILKGEKIKNSITGKFDTAEDYFIEEFEETIKLKEDPTIFRSQLISKLGAYSLDHPGQPIHYSKVLPKLIKLLKESFRDDQKKLIKEIGNNIVFYEAEIREKKPISTPLPKETKKLIDKVLHSLENKYGHSKDGALNILKYIIKEKY